MYIPEIPIGTVLCETSTFGWYPTGFYSNREGFCGFRESVAVMSLKRFYEAIQSIIGEFVGRERLSCDGVNIKDNGFGRNIHLYLIE